MPASAVKSALVIGGLCVAVLAVALYFIIAKSGTTDVATAEPAQPGVGSKPPLGSPSVKPGLPPSERPANIPPPAPGDNPRDYVVGDVRVRDHRSGDTKPLDVPPQAKPAESRVIPATLTHQVSQQVKTVALECAKTLPSGARGEKPRIEGQISIAIKDNKVTVTKSTMQLRDVTGDAIEATKQCIESKALGVTTPAAGEENLDDYSINVTIAIPKD